MTKTKTASTKTKRTRTGTKTTAKRNAGRAKAERVTAKRIAADIVHRDNLRAGFWDDVQAEVEALWRKERTPTRAAHVQPRETHATH